MKNKAKKKLERTSTNTTNYSLAGMGRNINEIKTFFTIGALSYAADKRELLNYRAMAVETGISDFIKNVDTVLYKRYPNYE